MDGRWVSDCDTVDQSHRVQAQGCDRARLLIQQAPRFRACIVYFK